MSMQVSFGGADHRIVFGNLAKNLSGISRDLQRELSIRAAELIAKILALDLECRADITDLKLSSFDFSTKFVEFTRGGTLVVAGYKVGDTWTVRLSLHAILITSDETPVDPDPRPASDRPSPREVDSATEALMARSTSAIVRLVKYKLRTFRGPKSDPDGAMALPASSVSNLLNLNFWANLRGSLALDIWLYALSFYFAENRRRERLQAVSIIEVRDLAKAWNRADRDFYRKTKNASRNSGRLAAARANMSLRHAAGVINASPTFSADSPLARDAEIAADYSTLAGKTVRNDAVLLTRRREVVADEWTNKKVAVFNSAKYEAWFYSDDADSLESWFLLDDRGRHLGDGGYMRSRTDHYVSSLREVGPWCRSPSRSPIVGERATYT